MDRMINPPSSAILKIGIQTVFWSYTGVKDFASFSRLDEMSTVKQITPDYPYLFDSWGCRSSGATFSRSDRCSNKK